MSDVQTLLTLPMETLVVLGAGYMGYRIAYTGDDQTHKTADVTFISLVFGLVCGLGMRVKVGGPYEIETSVAIGFAATILAAAIWKAYLANWCRKVLKATNVSYSDGRRSAWDSIRISTKNRPTQLVVRQKNGIHLKCDYLKSFEPYPHGPCVFGEDGSIALYVTHTQNGPGPDWSLVQSTSTELGLQMTYIPADQITAIEMRNLIT